MKIDQEDSGDVRGEVWLRDEGEYNGSRIEDYDARVARVETAGILPANNLFHARVLPPARRRDCR
jgi:hypothetical protein